MKYFEDDMDELFNKAGRDYPLKTDPPNWDAVRGALYPGEVVPPPVSKNGFRRYLPLLLLLLIPLGVYLFVDRNGSSSQDDQSRTKQNVSSSKKQVVAATNKKSVSSTDKVDVSSADKKSISSSRNDVSSTDKRDVSGADKKGISLSEKHDASTADNKGVSARENVSSNKKGNSLSAPNINSSTAPQRKNSFAKQNDRSAKQKVSKDALQGATSPNAQNIFSGTQSSLTKDLSEWTKFPPFAQLEKPEINIPVKQRIDSSTSVPNAKKKKPSNKTGFYYGVSAAPDISNIKGQEVKGTGYSAGIVAGYQLNAHWSVEAGVLWSRKKYYTDGKYFSKAGAQIPWSVDVIWLNGGCNMFEFPLLARYDFSSKKNTFFATAGLISYMMKTEDYKYGAKAGLAPVYYEGERKYVRSGDHLFSNLQLSAGYKFSLSPKMTVRVEPYLKAPLKKIGIGKMPITSAGLSFGITRDFR